MKIEGGVTADLSRMKPRLILMRSLSVIARIVRRYRVLLFARPCLFQKLP
jgi:hypothetical protein